MLSEHYPSFPTSVIMIIVAAISSPADKLHWVFQMYDKDNSNTIQVTIQLNLNHFVLNDDDGKTRDIFSYSENYFSVERDGGAFRHSLLIRGAGEGGRSNSYRQISGCDIILVLFLMHTLDQEAAVERAMKIFATLDIDNDGDVTEEEFVQGCLKDEELVIVNIILAINMISSDH